MCILIVDIIHDLVNVSTNQLTYIGRILRWGGGRFLRLGEGAAGAGSIFPLQLLHCRWKR